MFVEIEMISFLLQKEAVMRSRLCHVGLLCVLMLGVNLKADLVSSAGTNPDIDGTVIVWAESGAIVWDDIADPNVPQSILAQTISPGYPVICGGTIIWEAGASSSTKDLEGYGRSTMSYLDFGLDTQRRRYPDISGDRIVWQDYSNGNADIFMCDLSVSPIEPILVCTDTASQLYPAIDGNIVVWMDNRTATPGVTGPYQIYMCDVSETPHNPVPVSPNGHEQWSPAISGDLIVWAEDRGVDFGYDIYGYDFTTGQAYEVCVGTGEQNNPAVSGNLIVWQDDYSTVDGEYDIRVYDTATGQIQTVCDDSGEQKLPAISGRTVVWQEDSSGISYTILPTSKGLTLVLPGANEMFLAGSEMDISWTVEGPIEQVAIEFSSDNGSNWQIVESNVPAGLEYRWFPIFDVDSTECKIRISDFDDDQISDTLDGTLTVFQCDEMLTADVTGDCFVGLEDFAEMAAQWLTCGNPYDANWCLSD